mmetsp:Transcript_30193/g.86491  ORF Transcript_30193/g.86491 Transcript_30193/m.86491 type:complete len:270 (-) Transcript_30193:1161-1970(-)
MPSSETLGDLASSKAELPTCTSAPAGWPRLSVGSKALVDSREPASWTCWTASLPSDTMSTNRAFCFAPAELPPAMEGDFGLASGAACGDACGSRSRLSEKGTRSLNLLMSMAHISPVCPGSAHFAKSLSHTMSSGKRYECRACNVAEVVGSIPSTSTTTSTKRSEMKASMSSLVGSTEATANNGKSGGAPGRGRCSTKDQPQDCISSADQALWQRSSGTPLRGSCAALYSVCRLSNSKDWKELPQTAHTQVSRLPCSASTCRCGTSGQW